MKKRNSILWAVLMPVLILFVSSASAQSISSQTVTTAYQSAYSAYWGEVHSSTTGDAQTTGKSLYGAIETTLPALTDFWLEIGIIPQSDYNYYTTNWGSAWAASVYNKGVFISTWYDGSNFGISLQDYAGQTGEPFSWPVTNDGSISFRVDFYPDGDGTGGTAYLTVDGASSNYGSASLKYGKRESTSGSEEEDYSTCYVIAQIYSNTSGNPMTVSASLETLIPVELTSLQAASTNDAVELTWTTASETENLGYHVYRSMSDDGEYSKISKELIQGAGSSDQAHSYSYIDQDVKAGNTYYYKLADVDFNGNTAFHGPISVSVETVTPTKYALEQCYPNPFNPETAINFSIKQTGKVSLKIYNVQGQLIRSLVDEDKLAGSYSVIWNGTNEQGTRISSGTYLYTLKVNGFEDTKKLVFMK